jgi:hypothetical protein
MRKHADKEGSDLQQSEKVINTLAEGVWTSKMRQRQYLKKLLDITGFMKGRMRSNKCEVSYMR